MMGAVSHEQELLSLLESVGRIYRSDVSWERKYDRIFAMSGRISDAAIAAGMGRIDYYDPDASYEEDVRAYVGALERVKAEICGNRSRV